MAPKTHTSPVNSIEDVITAPSPVVEADLVPAGPPPAPHTYVRRQQAVTARQLRPDNADEVAAWCGGQIALGVGGGWFMILTAQAGLRAYAWDWLVFDEHAQYVVYTPDVFEKIFEAAA